MCGLSVVPGLVGLDEGHDRRQRDEACYDREQFRRSFLLCPQPRFAGTTKPLILNRIHDQGGV